MVARRPSPSRRSSASATPRAKSRSKSSRASPPVKKKTATAKRPASRKKTAVKKVTGKTATKRTAVKRPAAKKTAVRKKAPARRPSVQPKRTVREPRLLPGERWYVLDIPYEFYPWARAQGAIWHPVHRLTAWKGASLPTALRPYHVAPWSWGWHKEAELNQGDLQSPAMAAERWQPRPHQLAGIAAIDRVFAAQLPGFALADDVGLGKTMTAWGFVQRHTSLKKVLIVSTLNVLPHWRQTLLHAGYEGQDVLIINYDQLTKVLDWEDGAPGLVRKKGKRKRIAQKGKVPAYDLIIFDEAHKGRHPETARSILMRRLSARAKFTLWLSATIGTKPLELSYLAPLLGVLTGRALEVDTLKEFGEWCLAQGLGVKKGAYGAWVKLSVEDPKEADAALEGLHRTHQLLFESQGRRPPVALRRLPQDIAGWPEMERQLRPLSVGFEARQRIEEAWGEFAAEERRSPALKERPKKERENALVRLLRLRQAFSAARLDSTLELIEEMLENGKQVAVSVAFLPIMEHLTEALAAQQISVVQIRGGQSREERESNRLAFQKEQAQVILFTPEEGISLHQGEYPEGQTPRVLLIHDIRPSAIQMAQIEGRCHRDGRLAPVFWLFAEESAEMTIAQSVLGAVHNMKTMMGDDTGLVTALYEDLRQLALKST